MVNQDHHVAWKDRLGLNRVWEQCILKCIGSYGSDDFVPNVHLFHISLINIRDGPQLKQLVDDYANGELKVWKNNQFDSWAVDNRADARNPEISQRTVNEIDLLAHEFLYNFIVQTLEDNGFCFYQSKLEEDEIM